MISMLSSLLAGAIFGAGLAISQMMNPAKVIAFLDFAGDWDPTLAFVMAGAVLAAAPGFALAKKRDAPVLSSRFQIPTRREIDTRLMLGAAIFGVGWGLVGFCPGPAVAALGTGMWEVLVFVAAMLGGMLLYRYLPSR
jgi:uncharacterized membrane protein YedE/YeeE